MARSKIENFALLREMAAALNLKGYKMGPTELDADAVRVVYNVSEKAGGFSPPLLANQIVRFEGNSGDIGDATIGFVDLVRNVPINGCLESELLETRALACMGELSFDEDGWGANMDKRVRMALWLETAAGGRAPVFNLDFTVTALDSIYRFAMGGGGVGRSYGTDPALPHYILPNFNWPGWVPATCRLYWEVTAPTPFSATGTTTVTANILAVQRPAGSQMPY